MARFILIHGAWHGGWCWERLVPVLEARGHHVTAPDLPGMGSDAMGFVASLEDWAEFIARLLRSDSDRAILVGHSRGGIVVSRAAELVAEQVAASVYLAGPLVPPGRTMGEIMVTGEMPPDIATSITIDADGRTTRWTDPHTARRRFYNLTDEAVAAAAFARLSPEPTSCRDAVLHLTAERYGQVPRYYIECTRDGIVPIEHQRRMVAAEPCTVLSIESDHSPFYSDVSGLADHLETIAQTVAHIS